MLVRLEDEVEEGALLGEGRGVGGSLGDDALGEGEDLGEEVGDEVAEEGRAGVLARIPVRSEEWGVSLRNTSPP